MMKKKVVATLDIVIPTIYVNQTYKQGNEATIQKWSLEMNTVQGTICTMFYIDKARNENLVRQAAKYLQVSERRIYAILEDISVATIDNIAALSRFALECLDDDRLARLFLPDGYGIVGVSRGTLDGSLTDEIADVCEHSGLSIAEFRGKSLTQCRIHARQIIEAAQRMIAECDAEERRQTST